MADVKIKKRYRLRIIDPAYPAFNLYSYSARRTTPLGPICIATAVNKMEGWGAMAAISYPLCGLDYNEEVAVGIQER